MREMTRTCWESSYELLSRRKREDVGVIEVETFQVFQGTIGVNSMKRVLRRERHKKVCGVTKFLSKGFSVVHVSLIKNYRAGFFYRLSRASEDLQLRSFNIALYEVRKWQVQIVKASSFASDFLRAVARPVSEASHRVICGNKELNHATGVRQGKWNQLSILEMSACFFQRRLQNGIWFERVDVTRLFVQERSMNTDIRPNVIDNARSKAAHYLTLGALPRLVVL